MLIEDGVVQSCKSSWLKENRSYDQNQTLHWMSLSHHDSYFLKFATSFRWHKRITDFEHGRLTQIRATSQYLCNQTKPSWVIHPSLCRQIVTTNCQNCLRPLQAHHCNVDWLYYKNMEISKTLKRQDQLSLYKNQRATVFSTSGAKNRREGFGELYLY